MAKLLCMAISTLRMDPMPTKRILKPRRRGGQPVGMLVDQNTIDL